MYHSLSSLVTEGQLSKYVYAYDYWIIDINICLLILIFVY